MSDSQPYGIRAVDRAAAVLDVLAAAPGPVLLTFIATKTGLSVSTTFRLVRTLEAHGLVLGHEESGTTKYMLGFRIMALSSALQHQLDIVGIARPYLIAARDETTETVTLILREGDFYFHVIKEESPQALRHVPLMAVPIPLYFGASGRLLLASASDETVDAYMSRTGPAAADFPAPGLEALHKQLLDTRRNGFGESLNEQGSGGAAVAVPVYGHGGELLAAINITGPEGRFEGAGRGRWISAAYTAAAGVSALLGCADHPGVHVPTGDDLDA